MATFGIPLLRRPASTLGHRLSLAAAVALIAAAVSCPPATHAGETRDGVKIVRSMLEIRRDKVVIQEWDLSCGAAALATILKYQHADSVTEKDIARAMLAKTDSELVRKRLGFSLLDLKRFVDSRGYAGDGYGELDLSDLIEIGPAIVPIHLRTYDHFVVFRGVGAGRVVLADPAYGNRTMPLDEFLRVWRNRVAFVVGRRDGRPAPNRLTVGSEDPVIVPRTSIRTALP